MRGVGQHRPHGARRRLQVRAGTGHRVRVARAAAPVGQHDGVDEVAGEVVEGRLIEDAAHRPDHVRQRRRARARRSRVDCAGRPGEPDLSCRARLVRRRPGRCLRTAARRPRCRAVERPPRSAASHAVAAAVRRCHSLFCCRCRFRRRYGVGAELGLGLAFALAGRRWLGTAGWPCAVGDGLAARERRWPPVDADPSCVGAGHQRRVVDQRGIDDVRHRHRAPRERGRAPCRACRCAREIGGQLVVEERVARRRDGSRRPAAPAS